jgi:hypothetical protein
VLVPVDQARLEHRIEAGLLQPHLLRLVLSSPFLK